MLVVYKRKSTPSTQSLPNLNKQELYTDSFNERRDFFQKNFPLKMGRQRTDLSSIDILKNSCPVCGYLTLDERDSFEICGICYWEDDGIDDFEENKTSGPNHMTLKEGRLIFREAKRKPINTKFAGYNFIDALKEKFLKLDHLIEHNMMEKKEIMRQQTEILDMLSKNKVFGLDKLFQNERHKPNRHLPQRRVTRFIKNG